MAVESSYIFSLAYIFCILARAITAFPHAFSYKQPYYRYYGQGAAAGAASAAVEYEQVAAQAPPADSSSSSSSSGAVSFPPTNNLLLPPPPNQTLPDDLPPAPVTPGQGAAAGGKVWCIAKPSVDEVTLMGNIVYACGPDGGGLNCASIQPGGACYKPNSLTAHASFIMNLYYQRNQRNWWTCHFNGTGLVVFTDPSYGECIYSAQ